MLPVVMACVKSGLESRMDTYPFQILTAILCNILLECMETHTPLAFAHVYPLLLPPFISQSTVQYCTVKGSFIGTVHVLYMHSLCTMIKYYSCKKIDGRACPQP